MHFWKCMCVGGWVQEGGMRDQGGLCSRQRVWLSTWGLGEGTGQGKHDHRGPGRGSPLAGALLGAGGWLRGGRDMGTSGPCS